MSLAEVIERACVLEAAARKPGNVHPGAAFDDLCYDDFVRAAAASAPILARASELGIGRTVYDAVAATRAVAPSNVNLGICLLLAPLAAGAASGSLWDGARRALVDSTVEDTDFVYRAIRLANPGGLGRADEQDVSQPPTLTVPRVMALAADRDAIARELATGYHRLETETVPFLTARHAESADWERAILLAHLRLICEGETLIRRKCGDGICREAASRAARLLNTWRETDRLDDSALAEFDAWLRADGHRRNPGASADLIAAALFAALWADDQ
jgi:triphosphoribosyl-dephospho-CoA synthase